MHFEKKKSRRLEEEIIDLQIFWGDSRKKIKIEEIWGVSRSCGNPVNSAKDNQQFWHRYSKLKGNKTINTVEPLFRNTNKDEYTFDDAEISNILREVHTDKKDTHSNFDETYRLKIEKNTVNLMIENEKNTFSEVT